MCRFIDNVNITERGRRVSNIATGVVQGSGARHYIYIILITNDYTTNAAETIQFKNNYQNT